MPPNPDESSCTFICTTQAHAEQAILDLLKTGVPTDNILRLGRVFQAEGPPRQVASIRNRMIAWGCNGAFLGCILGILISPATDFLQPHGFYSSAGPVVSVLIAMMEGALILCALFIAAALLSPVKATRNALVRCDSAQCVHKYLLRVKGTSAEIDSATRQFASVQYVTQVIPMTAPIHNEVSAAKLPANDLDHIATSVV
jgi:hypothetical protein